MKKLISCFFLALAFYNTYAQHSFALGDSVFLLDGKPFQIISGEIHYPRVPREAWRHRMQMAKAMGLNTIGTYVFWNLQEPEKDKFDFSGNNDIAAFVKTAQEEGMWVILRPSPYVCAEWEFGGYPYWLQNEEGLVVRSKDPKYLAEYRKYINELGRQLSPYLVNKGGNIIMVQVENEYGSYGSDKEYLNINKTMFEEAGFTGLLYTCDPASDVAKGKLPGLLAAVNGVTKPSVLKKIVQKHNDGKGPYFVAEWYPAWFDWWGEKHHTVPAERYTTELDSMLGAGISINMYMFHGGTTRGFMNGANCYDTGFYEPQISSYDYDAPVDEAGNATDKFMQFRTVIQKHVKHSLPAVPAPKKAVVIPPINLSSATDIFSILPTPKMSETPLSFESLHQAYGFVMYRTKLNSAQSGTLSLKELRDYAVIFVNGKRVGTLNRMRKQDSLHIDFGAGEQTIDILVENLGRINYGPNLLKNKKGITERVLLNGQELKGWQIYSLPMNTVNNIKYNNKPSPGAPALKKGSFMLISTADTYLDMRNWGKGSVWINGHHLGRYWEIGPQQTIYVPAEWLKKGSNEIAVFELLHGENQITTLEKPILNQMR